MDQEATAAAVTAKILQFPRAKTSPAAPIEDGRDFFFGGFSGPAAPKHFNCRCSVVTDKLTNGERQLLFDALMSGDFEVVDAIVAKLGLADHWELW